MIKKKLIIIASSIFLTGAIVGTSIGVWSKVSSDKLKANGDPSSSTPITIIPTSIVTSDVDRAVLSWGDTGVFEKITDLMPGEERGPLRVGLKIDATKSQAFVGKLSVSVTSDGVGTYHALDYINVRVYEEEAKENLVLAVNHDDLIKDKEALINVSSGIQKDVYFYISLESDALSHLDDFKDEISITVNWDLYDDELPLADTTTYYFNNADGWSNVYAYAYNDNGVINLAYPGEKMSLFSGDIYKIDLLNEFTYVVFNDGDTHKTATLELHPSTPYYNGSSWTVLP